MGAKTGVTKHPAFIAIYQKNVSAGLSLIPVCVPELFDAAYLDWIEDADCGR